MDHTELLEKLGGPHAVHALLADRGVILKPVSVRAWALIPRNIPAKYWTHIMAIAEEKGVPLEFSDLADPVTTQPVEQAA